jgi:Tfp pilus assembly PilM family ATPase
MIVSRYLALDWDQNQLVVVAGDAAAGKARVRRALAFGESASPPAGDAVELGKRLREALKEAHVAPAPVLACLGRDRVIVKEIRHPAVPPVEEATLVRFQVVKELTDDSKDVVIDYIPGGAASGNGNGCDRRAVVLVARLELLEFYRRLCHAAGLTLAALTPRAFGLAACLRRALAAAPPEESCEGGATAAVAVGERWAEICVLYEGTLLLARSMAVGPNLAAEVRRNLSVYAGHAGRPPVRAVYITGATPELRERLSDLTDLPVHPFDPLAGAEAPDLPVEGRGAFAGAAGLLHARAAAGGLPINFVKPREPKPPPSPVRLRVALAALALTAVAVAAVGVCWWLFNGANRRLMNAQNQSRLYDKQLADLNKDVKMRGILVKADNAPAPDELYNLACYIPDVNALRLTSVAIEPQPRSSAARFTDRMTLKGTLLDNREPRKPLDQLIAALKADGHYSPEAPKVQGNTFTLVVNIERRNRSEYNGLLPPAPEQPKQPPPAFGGDF